MNHDELLIKFYQESKNIDSINIDDILLYENIQSIANNCFNQKAVYTVLITLIVHKIIDTNQDIRYHQASMRGGFSGRSIDTKFITPTLMSLGLPAMKESGWLTRSLEQPYPYNLEYHGKISNKAVKSAFLNIIDIVQTKPELAQNILLVLLHMVRCKQDENKIPIVKIKNPENLNINAIVNLLEIYFDTDYKTAGGSKLLVLAFYAIFQCLINELKRYENCSLLKMGSHTASDRTSKSSGDIEIINNNGDLIEAIEIKHKKYIDIHMLRIVKEKIINFNPKRYCVFSSYPIKDTDINLIQDEVIKIKEEHGCQVIVNGVVPTLKYYLRLIISLDDFMLNYSTLIESDQEIKLIHKEKWNQLLSTL